MTCLQTDWWPYNNYKADTIKSMSSPIKCAAMQLPLSYPLPRMWKASQELPHPPSGIPYSQLAHAHPSHPLLAIRHHTPFTIGLMNTPSHHISPLLTRQSESFPFCMCTVEMVDGSCWNNTLRFPQPRTSTFLCSIWYCRCAHAHAVPYSAAPITVASCKPGRTTPPEKHTNHP